MGRHVPRSIKKMEKEAFKADSVKLKEERRLLTIPNQAKRGVHNCPEKDAGTTHAFCARCISVGHGGYCPVCGGIFSLKHGCSYHSYRGDDLLKKSPSEQEKLEFRIANNINLSGQGGDNVDNEVEEEKPETKAPKRKGRKRSSTSARK